jgi:tetratricopeptide (TPR) repeat protein
MLTGKYKESFKYFREYTAIVQNYDPRIAYTFFKSGLTKEAEKYFSEYLDFCQNLLKSSRPYSQINWAYYDIASIYSFRGDKENALKNLKLYSRNKNCELWMLTDMKFDPLLSNIRNEPEFIQIEKEMENKYQIVSAEVGKWIKEQRMEQE